MAVNTPSWNKRIIEYKPQIDGLRFCAVFVVIFYHFMPDIRRLGFLDIGVLLSFFFVLSSYLITSILLTSKYKSQEAGISRTKTGVAFLIRRTLRIFPAYYFYLLLIFLAHFAGQYARDHAGMFFSYLANFQLYADQKWDGLTAHLWTLAVEEQFYLVWPWVVLCTPQKHLEKVFIFFILCGLASRALLFYLLPAPVTEEVSYIILTPTCLDCFGLGALLANQHVNGRTSNRIWKWLLFGLLPVWLFVMAFKYHFAAHLLSRFMVSLGAIVIIEGANTGYKGVVGKLLSHKVVLYLAKISYGIYLYHIFAAFLFWGIFDRIYAFALTKWNIDLLPVADVIGHPWIRSFVYAGVAVLLAALSWHFLERPINKLKKYFSYTAQTKAQQTGTSLQGVGRGAEALTSELSLKPTVPEPK